MARVQLRRWIATGLLSLCSGCAVFYRAPEITFAGVAVDGIRRTGASFDIALEVRNPNRYALGLDEMTYRLTVAGAEVASGTIPETVRIAGKSSAIVRLPVSLQWARLGAGGWQLLGSGRADYVVEGEAGFSTPAGHFRRPYHRAGTIQPFSD